MSKIEMLVDAATSAFQGERDRRDELQGKAEKFVAGIGAVAAFQLFDFEVLGEEVPAWVSWPSWSGLVLLTGALAVTLYSMKVQRYAEYPRERKLLDLLVPPTVTDEQAGLAITHVLLEAREQNALINDRRAKVLRAAFRLMLAGFVAICAGRAAYALM